MLKIKTRRMPYNFNDAHLCNGDWDTVREYREDSLNTTIIWVTEDAGVHCGTVSKDGVLLQSPPNHHDFANGCKTHRSEEFIANVVDTEKKPAKLL